MDDRITARDVLAHCPVWIRDLNWTEDSEGAEYGDTWISITRDDAYDEVEIRVGDLTADYDCDSYVEEAVARLVQLLAPRCEDPEATLVRALRASGLCLTSTSYRGQFDRPRALAVHVNEVSELARRLLLVAHLFTHAELCAISDLVHEAHVANMGMGYVLYWPQIEWAEEAAA